MIEVPLLSREEIDDIYPRYITPLVRFMMHKNQLVVSEDSNGFLYNIKNVDPFDVAYTWDPEIDPIDPSPQYHLDKVAAIVTYHAWGAPSFFKPSIAEVISQIPEELRSVVRKFEILNMPMDTRHVFQEGYHAALTILYKFPPMRELK